MPKSESSVQLSAKIERAKSLLRNIESHILEGKDQEADRLSREYEKVLDDILKCKSQTAECYIMKLNFCGQMLKVDHPIDATVDRIFMSLQTDFIQLWNEKPNLF